MRCRTSRASATPAMAAYASTTARGFARSAKRRYTAPEAGRNSTFRNPSLALSASNAACPIGCTAPAFTTAPGAHTGPAPGNVVEQRAFDLETQTRGQRPRGDLHHRQVAFPDQPQDQPDLACEPIKTSLVHKQFLALPPENPSGEHGRIPLDHGFPRGRKPELRAARTPRPRPGPAGPRPSRRPARSKRRAPSSEMGAMPAAGAAPPFMNREPPGSGRDGRAQRHDRPHPRLPPASSSPIVRPASAASPTATWTVQISTSVRTRFASSAMPRTHASASASERAAPAASPAATCTLAGSSATLAMVQPQMVVL